MPPLEGDGSYAPLHHFVLAYKHMLVEDGMSFEEMSKRLINKDTIIIETEDLNGSMKLWDNHIIRSRNDLIASHVDLSK